MDQPMTTRCNAVAATPQQLVLRLAHVFHLPLRRFHLHHRPVLVVGRHTQQMAKELATHHSTEPLLLLATTHDVQHRQPLQT